VAALELHVDLGERIVDPVARPDQAVVAPGEDQQEQDHDRGDDDDGYHLVPPQR
jgi:hypothetical protein